MQAYLSLTEHGIACTVREQVHAKSRSTVKHQLQVQTLKALAGAWLEIASPVVTLVRDQAERT